MIYRNHAEWACDHCNQTMNARMVQQGGMHVGCYPVWWDKKIVVYKIEHEGSSYYEQNLEHVQDMFSNMDVDSYYKVTKVTIKQGEYKYLPEFKGF